MGKAGGRGYGAEGNIGEEKNGTTVIINNIYLKKLLTVNIIIDV